MQTARTNEQRITRALELEMAAIRFEREGDPVWAARFRRNARLLRRITARKCVEA
jgi:hypothetical protein